MIVSLDDQLEWQESSKSHSPRTPSAPEIMQTLRLQSPSTPSKVNQALQSPQALADLSVVRGMEALAKLRDSENLHGTVIRAEFLCFPDGSTLPLGLLVPLQVRVIERKEDGDESMSDELVLPLTVGSAWLSLVAEFTYDSQIASLLRARKGMQEIVMTDRIILNRFLRKKLSIPGLKASKLWINEISESERLDGEKEMSAESDDVLSLRLKKKSYLDSLDERRTMLLDQQTRLRRLMARELQRMHSAKPASTAAQVGPPAPPSVQSPTPTVPGGNDVSNAVANMLKRFKPRGNETATTPLAEDAEAPNSRIRARTPDSAEMSVLEMRLKSLQVEWYRVGEHLRTAVETVGVVERKLKRLRYVID